MPLSKWSKQALLDAIEETYGEAMAEKAKACKLAGLRRRRLEKTSWHHVGKYATAVDFYGLIDYDAEACARSLDSLIQEEKEEKKEAKNNTRGSYELISFEATEWYGASIRHRRPASRFYFSALPEGRKRATTLTGSESKAKRKRKKDIRGIYLTSFKGKKAFFQAIKKACGKASADEARKALREFEKKTGLLLVSVDKEAE